MNITLYQLTEEVAAELDSGFDPETGLMKTCTKCGNSKPVVGFSKDARKRDGLRQHCKDCDKASRFKYRAANLSKILEKGAKYRAANPVNQSKVRPAKDRWAAANPEKVMASNAKWYVANKDVALARSKKWNAENKESRRIHDQNRRARESGGRLSKGLADKLFKLQRGKCACGCQQPLGDDYHLDHRMPLALGGSNTDDNMQLLRSTCNHQKSAKHPIDFMQQRGFLL